MHTPGSSMSPCSRCILSCICMGIRLCYKRYYTPSASHVAVPQTFNWSSHKTSIVFKEHIRNGSANSTHSFFHHHCCVRLPHVSRPWTLLYHRLYNIYSPGSKCTRRSAEAGWPAVYPNKFNTYGGKVWKNINGQATQTDLEGLEFTASYWQIQWPSPIHKWGI